MRKAFSNAKKIHDIDLYYNDVYCLNETIEEIT